MYGLTEKTMAAIQGVLDKHPLIEKVILYGSRAKGNYRNGSDIDIVLVGEKLGLSQLFKIELELDDLMLPYKIDVGLLHQIENKELIDHVNRRGVVFYKSR